jgi:hypothetical protein
MNNTAITTLFDSNPQSISPIVLIAAVILGLIAIYAVWKVMVKREKLNPFKIIGEFLGAILAGFTGIALVEYAVFGIQILQVNSSEFRLAIFISGVICILVAILAVLDSLKSEGKRG